MMDSKKVKDSLRQKVSKGTLKVWGLLSSVKANGTKYPGESGKESAEKDGPTTESQRGQHALVFKAPQNDKLRGKCNVTRSKSLDSTPGLPRINPKFRTNSLDSTEPNDFFSSLDDLRQSNGLCKLAQLGKEHYKHGDANPVNANPKHHVKYKLPEIEEDEDENMRDSQSPNLVIDEDGSCSADEQVQGLSSILCLTPPPDSSPVQSPSIDSDASEVILKEQNGKTFPLPGDTDIVAGKNCNDRLAEHESSRDQMKKVANREMEYSESEVNNNIRVRSIEEDGNSNSSGSDKLSHMSPSSAFTESSSGVSSVGEEAANELERMLETGCINENEATNDVNTGSVYSTESGSTQRPDHAKEAVGLDEPFDQNLKVHDQIPVARDPNENRESGNRDEEASCFDLYIHNKLLVEFHASLQKLAQWVLLEFKKTLLRLYHKNKPDIFDPIPKIFKMEDFQMSEILVHYSMYLAVRLRCWMKEDKGVTPATRSKVLSSIEYGSQYLLEKRPTDTFIVDMQKKERELWTPPYLQSGITKADSINFDETLGTEYEIDQLMVINTWIMAIKWHMKEPRNTFTKSAHPKESCLCLVLSYYLAIEKLSAKDDMCLTVSEPPILDRKSEFSRMALGLVKHPNKNLTVEDRILKCQVIKRQLQNMKLPSLISTIPGITTAQLHQIFRTLFEVASFCTEELSTYPSLPLLAIPPTVSSSLGSKSQKKDHSSATAIDVPGGQETVPGVEASDNLGRTNNHERPQRKPGSSNNSKQFCSTSRHAVNRDGLQPFVYQGAAHQPARALLGNMPLHQYTTGNVNVAGNYQQPLGQSSNTNYNQWGHAAAHNNLTYTQPALNSRPVVADSYNEWNRPPQRNVYDWNRLPPRNNTGWKIPPHRPFNEWNRPPERNSNKLTVHAKSALTPYDSHPPFHHQDGHFREQCFDDSSHCTLQGSIPKSSVCADHGHRMLGTTTHSSSVSPGFEQGNRNFSIPFSVAPVSQSYIGEYGRGTRLADIQPRNICPERRDYNNMTQVAAATISASSQINPVSSQSRIDEVERFGNDRQVREQGMRRLTARPQMQPEVQRQVSPMLSNAGRPYNWDQNTNVTIQQHQKDSSERPQSFPNSGQTRSMATPPCSSFLEKTSSSDPAFKPAPQLGALDTRVMRSEELREKQINNLGQSGMAETLRNLVPDNASPICPPTVNQDSPMLMNGENCESSPSRCPVSRKRLSSEGQEEDSSPAKKASYCNSGDVMDDLFSGELQACPGDPDFLLLGEIRINASMGHQENEDYKENLSRNGYISRREEASAPIFEDISDDEGTCGERTTDILERIPKAEPQNTCAWAVNGLTPVYEPISDNEDQDSNMNSSEQEPKSESYVRHVNGQYDPVSDEENDSPRDDGPGSEGSKSEQTDYHDLSTIVDSSAASSTYNTSCVEDMIPGTSLQLSDTSETDDQMVKDTREKDKTTLLHVSQLSTVEKSAIMEKQPLVPVESPPSLNCESPLLQPNLSSQPVTESAVATNDLSCEDIIKELSRRESLHSCECGMLFKDKILYIIHQGSHSHDGTRQCRDCGYAALSWLDFHVHMFNH